MKRADGVVTSKGQLVIPAGLRRALRMEKGTRVQFERIRGGVAIFPQRDYDIDRFRGILADYRLPPDLEREPDRDLR